MKIEVDIQKAEKVEIIPKDDQIKHWVNHALDGEIEEGMLTVRIVDHQEMQNLNLRYRNKNKATNVLAFPYDIVGYIGDVVLCAPIVNQEARIQGKLPESHWAHLIIHGCLHCVGYDHMTITDRHKMEAKEIQILSAFDYSNPYEEEKI